MDLEKGCVSSPFSRRDVLGTTASTAFAISELPSTSMALPWDAPKIDQPVVAIDRNGLEVTEQSWLDAHKISKKPDLVVGPLGEPYFLLVRADARIPDDDGGEENSSSDTDVGFAATLSLERYALKAECTHLGCLVSFDVAEGRGFACPCHGSKYSAEGTVRRGPAPKSLGLAEVSLRDDGKVLLAPWKGADFRTSEA